MDPEWMRTMATRLPNGHYLHCPRTATWMYDDQATSYKG
jgi:hypothetical protein